ncbi:MAG: glycosyltransferase family 4 protein [Thermoplasmata archaeon]|nr:glycosyltransferase family 4 protein [Thermoplasmata archaeon]
MKVLMTAIRYPPAPGGAEDHVHEVVNHLTERGHDVVVYTSDMWKEHPFERMTEPHDIVDGVRVVRKRTYQMSSAIHYPVMPGMFELLRAPGDVVHAHSFGYYHTNVAALRKRLSGTPLVITPHYHPPETMQGGFARHQLRKVYDARIANWVFEQADAMIFNSHAELASMAHHVGDMDKTQVIPNGLHTQMYEDLPDPAPFREERGIGGPMVLYLGRLAVNKRMELVINALPTLVKVVPDLKLVIAGPDDGVGEEWKALTRSKGLEDHVRFEGFLSEEDKLAAFTAADVFVLPSEWEAYGLVLMEAQACGTPCVVADRGGPKEVIAPGETGIVAPFGDEEAWTGALLDLLTDDGLRGRMGRAARERAMTVFRWSNIIDQIETVYRDVTGLA